MKLDNLDIPLGWTLKHIFLDILKGRTDRWTAIREDGPTVLFLYPFLEPALYVPLKLITLASPFTVSLCDDYTIVATVLWWSVYLIRGLLSTLSALVFVVTTAAMVKEYWTESDPDREVRKVWAVYVCVVAILWACYSFAPPL